MGLPLQGLVMRKATSWNRKGLLLHANIPGEMGLGRADNEILRETGFCLLI